MTPFEIHHGDCIEVMRGMADASVDSIVTDPPYELGFMGKSWDSTGIANSVEMWREALRVLKPGGHLLAFSGTRTQHRMVCAIEDAGFEVRDQFGWAYGSGFPKSRNVAADMEGEDAEQWEGWGTAVKPAWEPVCFARKPLAKGLTVAANVLSHGTGAINISGCRIGTDEVLRAGAGNIPCRHHEQVPRGREGQESANARYAEAGGTDFAMSPGPRGGDPLGRWPANIIHDGSAEVLAAFPDAKGQQGDLASHGKTRQSPNGIFGGMRPALDHPMRIEAETSAARFFYCAKTTRTDRNEGCESLPQKVGGMVSNTSGQHLTRRDDDYEAKPLGNFHPTVKPTDLMAYLCRLVTPPGGTVLDPFMGSGSTGKACMREGFNFIGIDMTAEYIAIAKARIEYEQTKVAEAAALASIPAPQFDLFDSEAA